MTKLPKDWSPPEELTKDFRVYTGADGTQIRLYMSPRCIEKHLAQHDIKKPVDERIKSAPDIYAKVRIPKTKEEGKGFWDIRFRILDHPNQSMEIIAGRKRVTDIRLTKRDLPDSATLADSQTAIEIADEDRRLATAGSDKAQDDPDFLDDDGDTEKVYVRLKGDDKKTKLLETRTNEALTLLERFRDHKLVADYSLGEAYESTKAFVVSHAQNPQANTPRPEHSDQYVKPKRRADDDGAPKPRIPDRERRHPRQDLKARIEDGDPLLGTASHTDRAEARRAKGKGARGKE